jgi:hypothetical protein
VFGIAALTALLGGASLSLAPAALAAQYPLTNVVSATPAAFTPDVLDGAVNAITQVGNTIVIGGTFTTVSQHQGGAQLKRTYVMAFDARTGVISTAFNPKLDGQVRALAASPDGDVFVGGDFTKVNGVAANKLAKISLSNGQKVTAFKATAAGSVYALKVHGSKLYVGGGFSFLSGGQRKMLGAVNVTTGALDPSLNLPITGQHSGGFTYVTTMDVSADGSKLVVGGNFTTIAGLQREQLGLINLTGSQATVSAWATSRLELMCAKGWRTYAQSVDFAPDGTWFALAATGGPFVGVCDAVTRWNVTSAKPNQVEAWSNKSGGDSLLSVAVTPAAVYTGGHQRWMNNAKGHNSPGPGSVPREGIAALSPTTGLALPWNPGRTRGHGAAALMVTSQGLWVGSDTDTLAGQYHAKIGLFPAA